LSFLLNSFFCLCICSHWITIDWIKILSWFFTLV